MAVVRTICCTAVAADDSLQFDAESVAGESIIEAGNYAGVRVRLVGYLGTARIPVQIDVGLPMSLAEG